MATSLLRLGRLASLKCFQLENRGILRSRSAAWFCTQAEEPAKPTKKTKAVSKQAPAPPEPEEPFDNRTYKNCQHHKYTPHTFSDLDVEMAKFRLPQPSSVRH
ncbi:NADH dehydrogenase [ubiquinone] flavoprotein 3, mitochondrial-like isoform X2 [Clinocottus analis]|uniref:NADH dehydrogenase [ubiquinone] flavoprotein 3, mitochondrial-like isoform X2 n=1 Tax=Clinocottus analis TaxID=304258 RepID=UPI0035C089E7